MTEFPAIMKASICEDLTLFRLICHYIVFLDLMEQSDELNENVAGDSPSFQNNVPIMFWELGRNSETAIFTL